MEWNNSINDTHFTLIMCFLLGQYFQHALCHCGRPQRIRGETFVPRADHVFKNDFATDSISSFPY